MTKREVYNGGEWTKARYDSFVKGLLRQGSSRWGPKNRVKSEARVRRGFYLCNGCKQVVPATLPPEEGKVRRVNNAVVDHIDPVVDPAKGFTTWDDVINRMFCEQDNLQVLCHSCHKIKTAEEREIAKARRAMENV